jgi:hypothetical protein
VRYIPVGDPESPHTPSQPLASFDCRAASVAVKHRFSKSGADAVVEISVAELNLLLSQLAAQTEYWISPCSCEYPLNVWR